MFLQINKFVSADFSFDSFFSKLQLIDTQSVFGLKFKIFYICMKRYYYIGMKIYRKTLLWYL